MPSVASPSRRHCQRTFGHLRKTNICGKHIPSRTCTSCRNDCRAGHRARSGSAPAISASPDRNGGRLSRTIPKLCGATVCACRRESEPRRCCWRRTLAHQFRLVFLRRCKRVATRRSRSVVSPGRQSSPGCLGLGRLKRPPRCSRPFSKRAQKNIIAA